MNNTQTKLISNQWLALGREPIIEPARPIIDAHHHLWPGEHPLLGSYGLEDFWTDTETGHRIEKSVFVECRAAYRESGPEHMKPVGETEFIAEIAARSAANPNRATIGAIVAFADLCLGAAVEEVLSAHETVSSGLLRGVRHSAARDPHPDALLNPGQGREGQYEDPGFREGVRRLGQLGYTYDTFQFHHQLPSLIELARAVPETNIIVNHLSTPLGVGPYQERRKEIFERWRRDIRELASFPNVFVKLGGLCMPDTGYQWHEQSAPPNSDQLVTAQGNWYHRAIEHFGPERCMFESNFPVDKISVSYPVFWNAMKKLGAEYSSSEQDDLFYGTAERVYRL